MRRDLIRDLAEERLANALGYIAHYQEGDDMESLREVAVTALEEWAKARMGDQALLSAEASKGTEAGGQHPEERGP